MSAVPIKYNPAFLSDAELAAAFVVRQNDLDSILRVVRDNTDESNQHVLVVGPRGIGKTMLVRRASLAVRQDAELSRKWYPLIFAEESYEVGTAGEFWLESLFHLANQTGDAQWLRTYEELRDEPAEDRLHERALAQLMDFADRQGRRILLVVENLNMILGDQLRDADAWKLRKTLMHEPRVMLLATATARLDGPANLQKAMYELFKTQPLHPLGDRDCQAVWRSVAGHDPGLRRIRAIRILTGGNPRLLAVMAHFGARMSFSELMQDMTSLVDDHTDYFKSHLDALPATERKVYVALADLWDPATARAVATAARQSVSQTSAMLKRLVSRGAVSESPGTGRAKRYQVTDRMYNFYYLMRRRGGPSERVKLMIQLMVQFYGEIRYKTAEIEPQSDQAWHVLDAGSESVHTQVCGLLQAGRSDEALAIAAKLLQNREWVAAKVEDMVALFAELVAAGLTAKALALLGESPSAEVLEPILVALKMELGTGIHVAPEIAEVAGDVRKRFEEVRARRSRKRGG
ncbi:MAG: ATP-binding protein [Lentisphaeria bacterium]|jgi:hypothetical protein|nr:ATP-binding protein [Lentisphaeria bacterium]